MTRYQSLFDAVVYRNQDFTFVKQVSLDNCDRASFDSLLNNIMLLKKLSAYDELAQVLQFPVDCKILDNNLLVQYPISKHGSIWDFMKRRMHFSKFAESVLCPLIARIVRALYTLHSSHLIHRAINPYHIILRDSHEGSSLGIQLSGLGSVCRYSKSRCDIPLLEVIWRGWHYKQQEQNPIVWYAPEMLLQDYNGYDYAVDIYSLGLLTASLFTGKALFSDCNDYSRIYLEKVSNGLESQFQNKDFFDASSDFVDFYNSCTNLNPAQRIKSYNLMTHPWIMRGLEIPLTSELLESLPL